MIADPSPTSPNVFLAGAIPGGEDRFTAHWHYLLDCHPELAQRVLDLVADRTGLARTRYAGASDHPWYTRESQPDFLLRGEAYDVLCEHKLDSQLGPAQMERYCGLVEGAPRPAYVILVSKSPLPVPAGVLDLPAYRRPGSAATTPVARRHFLWEDFYPLVAETPGRLAADFRVYMAALGLEPWSWGTMGDPFTDPDAAAQVRRLWAEVLPRYRRPGVVVKPDPQGVGFQYQRPMAGVHLIWAGPYRVIDAPSDPRVPGRAMVARVWQVADGRGDAELLPRLGGVVDLTGRAGFGAPTYLRSPMTSGREVGVLTREYYSPLGEVLRESVSETQASLVEWLDAVLAHLSGSIRGGNAGLTP